MIQYKYTPRTYLNWICIDNFTVLLKDRCHEMNIFWIVLKIYFKKFKVVLASMKTLTNYENPSWNLLLEACSGFRMSVPKAACDPENCSQSCVWNKHSGEFILYQMGLGTREKRPMTERKSRYRNADAAFCKIWRNIKRFLEASKMSFFLFVFNKVA